MISIFDKMETYKLRVISHRSNIQVISELKEGGEVELIGNNVGCDFASVMRLI